MSSAESRYDDNKTPIQLADELPEFFLVENFSFHQSPCLSDFPIDLLVAYQRRNVLSAPRCSVDILGVIPSDRYQFNASQGHVLDII